MNDQIDPEIAALIGDLTSDSPSGRSAAAAPGAAAHGEEAPDFGSLFGDLDLGDAGEEAGGQRGSGVDLTRRGFAPIKKMEEPEPKDWFSDPEYYKKVLGGEGEEATKLHEVLGRYLKATDPKDKGVFRQQILPAYWYLAGKVALRCAAAQPLLPKRFLLRYGALLPSVLSPEMRDMIGRIVFEKEIDEPVYYVDEWVKAVATGQIGASATDEVKVQRGDDSARYAALIQKTQGKRDAAEGILKAKVEERRSLESTLHGRIDTITNHAGLPSLPTVPAPYTDSQRKAMSEVSEIFRRLLAADKEFVQSLAEYEQAGEELKAAREKAEGVSAGEAKANVQSLAQEFEAVRQMHKLCIGRQGNHFPFLTKEYFHGGLRDIGTRENVVRLMAWIESIDVEAYCRPYKNQLNRIVPYVILLPSYGDAGICWEPFDRYNRASSRGRIAVPMYPKNLAIALITAIADLRWQVAKEKASYYWMEEGLTGNYYQWFTSRKMKGDVKEYFIQDYILWITKESEGTQKLDKEVRAIFWRLMPFAQEIKDKLKTRSLIYQELYQKDINRSMSDGY